MSAPPPPPLTDRRHRLLALGALWVFLLVVVVAFRSVMLPFLGAALIAYLVQPLVTRITRVRVAGRPVPRWVAILCIYAVFFLGVYLFFVALVPQLYLELARISREGAELARSLTPERIQEIAQRAEAWLNAHGVPVSLSTRALEGSAQVGGDGRLSFAVDLEQVLRDAMSRFSLLVQENFGDIINVSRQIVTGVLAAVFMLFFILMVAAFFSIDAATVMSYGRSLVPPEWTRDAKWLVGRIDRSLAGVVRGQLTICLVNGVLTFVGLLVFGVKFAFLLATVATFFSLIPIFGTILSSVPIVLIALADGVQKGLAILVWIIGIHALEAYFLNPKIMGSAARIHPVVVAFALIAGEHFFGLIGALLAVPAAAIVVACFDYLRLKAQPGSALPPGAAP